MFLPVDDKPIDILDAVPSGLIITDRKSRLGEPERKSKLSKVFLQLEEEEAAFGCGSWNFLGPRVVTKTIAVRFYAATGFTPQHRTAPPL